MYLGYDKVATDALTVSRPRRAERKAAAATATASTAAPSRSVFQVGRLSSSQDMERIAHVKC